ncbi:hypothetical protein RhiirC2_861356 [Rhizophagus irregularis]|uniref:Uncharacterized protein n=1 Tax=Rhizophagus irregularis TaxID=588596 RepID=A0A2N1NWS1_9GLOM|nr:hypothetical protein RhiirC2_861356 [Rhizophagus irregularis]
MSDDIEAQEYNVHENILDGLISRSRKIESIKSLEKCNGADEIIQLDKLVHDLVNSKVENLPCYGSLTKLKELIKLEDEKLISEFFDYCAKLCIEEEKLELMSVVTILLQDFISIPLYKSPVSRLIKRLTYVKVPSKWCEKVEFISKNENLYGYKTHNDVHNPELSTIDSVIAILITFKEIGIITIVIAHICRKILWLFVFLALIVLAASHATVTYSNMMLDYDKTSLTDETRTKFQDLTQYYNSLNAYWSAFLSDYVALVNNIYSEVLNRAYTEWSVVRAQYIVFTELALMTPSERQNKDYFPWTIFYEVFTEEVERWHKKLEEDNVSISRNKIQLLNEMADKMKDEIIKMEDDDVIKTTMIDKLNELKQLFSKK